MIDFEWMVVGVGEVVWIVLVFVFGLFVWMVGLFFFIGYLVVGFLLGL